ncbi:MAG: ACT domain-containing protein [Acidobacteria bacterium]|nr:ACT domain-containing protein [Acidobacteriota bacterium]
MLQTVQILMEDKPGVLMRAIGVVTAKGFNIISLSVGPDLERPGVACATLVADVEDRLHARVVNELNRQVQVLRARDLTSW